MLVSIVGIVCLYDVIYQKRESFESIHSSNFTRFTKKDKPYFDLGPGEQMKSESDCMAKCNSNAACMMYAWNDTKTCWLKTADNADDRYIGIKGVSDHYYINKDLPYGDIDSFNSVSATECKQKCESNDKCGVYVYSAKEKKCWIKEPGESNDRVTIGYKLPKN